ncbi:MAG: DUF1732 domain-containing protein, partial [Pseudomonadota bacterium]
VNGRGLDVRVATPPGFDALERAIKTKAAARFKRGNLQIGVRIELTGDANAGINQSAIQALAGAYEDRMGEPPAGPAFAALLAVPGVLDMGGRSSAGLRELSNNEAAVKSILASVDLALDDLADARRTEGAALKRVLDACLDQMLEILDRAREAGDEQPRLLKTRLEAKLADLAGDLAIDADRLAAEAALAAAKADVREEFDRLMAHIETARTHLAAGSPVGRKLDFLAQELNREANTLCAKSASLDLTNAGLGLKALIDQFKEQAANVE